MLLVKFALFYLLFAPWVPFIALGGLFYFSMWCIEQWEWVERNPVDELWEDDISPWLDEIFELEYVRYPFLWLEYQVTILMGSFEFDYNDPGYLWMFYSLIVPWLWLLVYLILDPFLVGLMPILVLIANADIYIFAEEHEIWVEEVQDGVKDERKMNDIEAAFAGLSAGPEDSLIHTTIPRYRKTILVAKGGVAKLIARIYQL